MIYLQVTHCLTLTGQWEMRLDYQIKDKTYLHYNQFSVGSASEEYPLTVGGFTGVGTDWFAAGSHNGMKFSTPDNQNDNNNRYSCAGSNKDGWWYNNCGQVSLSYQPPTIHYGLLFAEMKIRPKDCYMTQ